MEKKQILKEALAQLDAFALTKQGRSDQKIVCSLSQETADLPSLSLSECDQSYRIMVQPWAPQKDIGALIAQIKSQPEKTILFADFVNPVMAEKLRQRSIAFVDCAGNLSIKNKQVDWYVKRKKQQRLADRRIRGRAFNTAGLKLIFAIFNQPRFLNLTYRDISNKVNIALGSVGPVIDDLYASGYILDDGRRRLVNKKRLFERWVDGYLEKLRPKQIMQCYSSEDPNWWKQADPTKFLGLWGGEVIIAKATPFMMPETITLYFSSYEKQAEFARQYGLKEDSAGDICIYRSFWSPSYAGDDNVDGISPMIIYADIVDSINPGSWDVAKTFYGEAVAHLLND
jgi:hypothetical protein